MPRPFESGQDIIHLGLFKVINLGRESISLFDQCACKECPYGNIRQPAWNDGRSRRWPRRRQPPWRLQSTAGRNAAGQLWQPAAYSFWSGMRKVRNVCHGRHALLPSVRGCPDSDEVRRMQRRCAARGQVLSRVREACSILKPGRMRRTTSTGGQLVFHRVPFVNESTGLLRK